MVLCRVQLLDGKDYQCELDNKAEGREILERVFDHLNLLERDYFGLTYRGHKNLKFWLISGKKIDKQLKDDPWDLKFEVKFYVPDPASLREELTRYLLFLQVRIDIKEDRLPCSFLTQALLCSYAVQSQLGDYSPELHGDGVDYIREIPFSSNQSEELLEKIAELHRLHKGMINAEAELQYLENARAVAMYGVHMHSARDSSGEEVKIGVCAMGLLIFRDKIRSNRFPWAKIIYVRYKNNHFIVKIRPPEDRPRDSEKIKYKLDDVKLARRLWRIAVEHHVFFRMREAAEAPRSMFWRSHSRFYYAGRTEYQTQLAADAIPRSGNDFNRISGRTNGEPGGGAGYSTERAEQCISEESRIATLNIRRPVNQQSGSRGSLPWGSAAGANSETSSHNRTQEVELLLGEGGGGARYNNGWGESGTGGSRAGDLINQSGTYYPGGEPHYDTVNEREMRGEEDMMNSRLDQDDWRQQFEGGRGGGGLIDDERFGGTDQLYPQPESDEARLRRLAAANAAAGGGRLRSRQSSGSSSRSSSVEGWGISGGWRGERGMSPQSIDDQLKEYDEQYEGVREDMDARPVQRDQYGNVIITKNIYINRRDRVASRQSDRMSRMSLDESFESGREGGFGRGAEGGDISPNGTSRTTSRTYTAPDGTVITEYRTERNGVITTRIEKRTRVIEDNADMFDYDKALHDAIFQVTNMNPDLDVEKIEIHTKAEERYDDAHYSEV